MKKVVDTMISSFLKTKDKALLKITPGPYFKLSENERTMIKEPTTGLLVSSFLNEKTGKPVYNVALVDGELLLISTEDPCLIDSQK
jgi:hypothetical protein